MCVYLCGEWDCSGSVWCVVRGVCSVMCVCVVGSEGDVFVVCGIM